MDINQDDNESMNELNDHADEVDDAVLLDMETPTKLNEAKLLEMMDILQKENQKLMHLFERNSALNMSVSQQGTTNSSSWLNDERQELLNQMLGEKFSDHRDEQERQAILANPSNRDFYLLLTRKLYCMINSCENLSSGLVSSGNGTVTSKMLLDRTNPIRASAVAGIGAVVGTALKIVKEAVPGVKLVAEPIHSMFHVIVTLKNKRDQYLAVARVADFANVASILESGNSKALQSTIEKFARMMIRARSSLPSFPFTEKQDKFGRMKQYMLNMLADSGNTPVKEQASFAADCAVAHIMMPSKGSILNEILNGNEFETSLPEALAAAVLNVSIDQVRNLDPISHKSSDIMDMAGTNLVKANANDPLSNVATFTVHHASDDEDDNELDFSGYSNDVFHHLPNDNYVARRMVPTNSVDVEQLEDKVADLERKIESLNKVQNSFTSKMKKEDTNSAGDGLMYADFREQYKDDVHMLKRQAVDCDERVSFHASEIAILKEQVQMLQKQLSESAVTSSTQQAPAPTARPASEKNSTKKSWISRRRDPKDP